MAGGKQNFAGKLQEIIRVDRAILLVWRAHPRLFLSTLFVQLVQGTLPLAGLLLFQQLVDLISATVQAVQQGDGQSGAPGLPRIPGIPGATSVLSGWLTDYGIHLSPVGFLVLFSGAIALVAGLQAIFSKTGEYLTEKQTSLVSDLIFTSLHKKSLELDLSYYEDSRYYDTLHRAQREGPYRPARIVSGLTRLLQAVVGLCCMVGLLVSCHWLLGVLLFIATLPGLAVQMFHARKQFNWQKRRTADERRAMYFSSVLTGDSYARELRIFQLGTHFSALFDGLRTILRREKLTLAKRRAAAEGLAQLFSVLVLFGCMVFITLQGLAGAVTVGSMVIYFQGFQRGISHLRELLRHLGSLYEDNLFLGHFYAFLEMDSTIPEPTQPQQLPPVGGRGFELDQVSFNYPGRAEPVLKNCSLRIAPGEVVALVGRNGSGKSTLIKLLCRLYDVGTGAVRLEGTDIRTLKIEEFRSTISTVFQDFSRYVLSGRENIGLGDLRLPPDAEQICEAARITGADAFLDRLPQGFDTLLGRYFYGGQELSVGEWQKLALARAILHPGRLLILDEPTSSMDVHSEYQLYSTFRQMIGKRSALIISHRFATVRMADRIYVLDEGRIVEEGSHQQLMDACGHYASMIQASRLQC